MHLWKNLTAISLCVNLAACASIVGHSKYPVSIASSPAGASYEIKNEKGVTVHSGVTPDEVVLPSSAGYFDGEKYQVTFHKDGYNSNTAILDSSVSGWYWANILLGGLIGMLIVDPATGAMYKLPERTSSDLSAIAPPASPIVAASTSLPTLGTARTKEQLLDELAADKSLSYDEYKRRYEVINRQN